MISDVSTRATKGESYDANLKTARIVHEIAAATHAPPGQIALAWCSTKATTSCQSLAPSAANFSKRT